MVCDREAGERGRPSGEQEERRWGSAEIGGSVCCLQRDGVMGKLGGGGGGGEEKGREEKGRKEEKEVHTSGLQHSSAVIKAPA